VRVVDVFGIGLERALVARGEGEPGVEAGDERREVRGARRLGVPPPK